MLSPPNPLSSSPERLHGLDATRALALLAGVVLHACMAYIPGAKYFWPMADTGNGVAAGLIFYWIHLFRMTTFFLIAGFFGRLLIERTGTGAFAADRLRRIVLPLLAGWPLVMTGIVGALVLAAYLKNGYVPPAPANGPKFTPDDFPLTHLWFLYALALLYCVTLLLRFVIRRVDRQRTLAAWIDRALPVIGGYGAVPLLATPLAFALWAQPGWYLWFGVPTPDHALIPNVAACVAYGVAFAAGWILGARREVIFAWQCTWFLNLVLALVATGLCLAIAGVTPRLKAADWDGNRALYAASYALASWAWTIGLIGAALRFLNRKSTALRYVADASYWIYLVHLPLVMAVQGALVPLGWPWPLKLLIVIAATLLVSMGSYRLMVRNTAIGRWLNGRRAVRDATA